MWWIPFLLACSGADGKDSGPAEPSCDSDSGWIDGTVVEYEGGRVPAATVYLVPQGGDMLETRADEGGVFTVELPAGPWTLSAEDRQGCFTGEDLVVEVEACSTLQVELVMELWVG